jgi:MFS superfamily sulfate permease-like transporter
MNRGSWLPPTLGRDALASVVVFLVALPLCVGIAIASGVPPERGLVTGIIGGLVVGFLSGAPLQVSGPAAGLAVLVWQLVDEHGLAMLGPVVLLAGLAQLAAGALRIGTWFRAVSPGVILGMLAGIGVLIAAAQVHVMVDDKPGG